MILVHEFVVLLLCLASHVRFVGVELFLLQILGAWVLLYAFFLSIAGKVKEDGLLLESVQVDVINVCTTCNRT